MRPAGIFVTGTDTNVGKTIVAACLTLALGARYWKPAQTGAHCGDDDTATVSTLAALPPERIHPPRYRLAAPLSPEAAGAREGIAPSLADFILPPGSTPIVVEGAGGVLVPLNATATMADLMRHLGLPALLVARSTLGTINHTLLSVEALRARAIPLLGVVMVGPDPRENAAAIARHGQVPLLATLPWLTPLTPEAVATQAAALHAALRARPEGRGLFPEPGAIPSMA